MCEWGIVYVQIHLSRDNVVLHLSGAGSLMYVTQEQYGIWQIGLCTAKAALHDGANSSVCEIEGTIQQPCART